ncbi:MAG: metal-dependent transcriptional regulator [Chloroflexi bacterium]|nr:metal-dependent transcriptional regulator [Chloroflexota bacterium]
MISRAIEDYVKAIFQLRVEGHAVTTSALADALGISNASATNMIKKLAKLKLARHSPYRGVELTRAGEKIALEIIRHHRLIETFLTEALGVPWDRVHAEAEKIEHVISEDLEERIANFLGNPRQDPHGDPIPSKALEIEPSPSVTLADIPVGQSAVIRRFSDQDPERLRHFSHLGLVPNATVNVIQREPFAGPVRVRAKRGAESVLDEKLARTILVSALHRQGAKHAKKNLKSKI